METCRSSWHPSSTKSSLISSSLDRGIVSEYHALVGQQLKDSKDPDLRMMCVTLSWNFARCEKFHLQNQLAGILDRTPRNLSCENLDVTLRCNRRIRWIRKIPGLWKTRGIQRSTLISCNLLTGEPNSNRSMQKACLSRAFRGQINDASVEFS